MSASRRVQTLVRRAVRWSSCAILLSTLIAASVLSTTREHRKKAMELILSKAVSQ